MTSEEIMESVRESMALLFLYGLFIGISKPSKEDIEKKFNELSDSEHLKEVFEKAREIFRDILKEEK